MMLQSLKKISNSMNLKILTILLMFLDHIYEMFGAFGAPMWLTMLGRVVFPLFMFLVADSFYYTHNRKAYLKRLLFMTWFMIIGNMIVSHFFTNGQVGLANNAFGAFFLAGISICAWDLMVEGMKEEKFYSFWKGLSLFLLPVLLALPALFLSGYLASENISPLMVQIIAFFIMAIPNILVVEGGYAMVYLGLFFYIFRRHRMAQMVTLTLVSLFVYLTDPTSVQWMMVFAVIPMYFYNGEKGRDMKLFFYIFYPAHIYLLYILASLLG
ncbi:hypothetical protein ANG6_1085 [Streptococcus anginosus T5]|uniref:TraX protein n=1 Tax=Streptococcus anginosus T5 TaxID=1163302 RepID=A0AAN4P8Z3_STRAP|nr:TraX family protein [Streptococcus anginosus]GAD46590.1 hypothetical protein ANG6_1085 [Streptococcus anginosus T5]